MWRFIIATPKRHFLARKRVVWRIDRQNRSTLATFRRGEETKRKKKGKSQTVIFRACAETPHAGRSLPYLEAEVGSRTQLRTPSFVAIGSGALLPGVAENPTFPIHSALPYTTSLGYRSICDNQKVTVGVSCSLSSPSYTIFSSPFLLPLPLFIPFLPWSEPPDCSYNIRRELCYDAIVKDSGES